MEEKKLYRVENQREQHGLWRDFDGHLSPIFDKLTDGAVKDLPMGDSPLYRAGGNKWFSACETPEMLTHWFSDGDIKELVKLGYGVYEFTATNYKLVSNFETVFTRDSVKECRQISYKEIWKDHDMKFRPIVKSLLDTDLYKFNMNQVMFHKHTNLSGKYVFKCRNEGIVFTKEMLDEINAQVDNLCTMTFTKEEIAYLHTIRFLKPDYIEFLRIWRPLRDYVDVKLNDAGKLSIEVTGPLYGAMQFEIYLLEIVSEVYFRFMYADSYDSLVAEAKKRLLDKIEGFKSGKYTFSFADFGARRRFSGDFQDWALSQLKDLPNCVGTSDVYFAMKYGMKPIGTYAHEFVQMYQGIPTIPLAYTNHAALEDWFDEYRGDNGTALTDTITTDLFLKDFDYLQARVYSGVRHDSGDPFEWGEKIIAHYKKLGIDPTTKTLLFSDSLDFDKAQRIYAYFKYRTKVAFGIGTFVMNDSGVTPLNIVIKLQYVNGRPVAKLSDCDGKTMCEDPEYVKYLRNAIEFRLKEEK